MTDLIMLIRLIWSRKIAILVNNRGKFRFFIKGEADHKAYVKYKGWLPLIDVFDKYLESEE